jgi:DNA-binding PadR family transcriptional regulator
VSISEKQQGKAHPGALSPEYALLGLLAQGPAHGYELHQKLAADLGQVWHISLSQSYNILNRLEAQGYIAGTIQEQEKLPARRLFQLTPLGRRRFENWLHTTSGSSVRSIRLEFLTRLYFARLKDPALAHGLVETQIAETRRGLERLRSLYDDLPAKGLPINRLSLELRLRQLESVLEWLQSCHKAIDAPPGDTP